ncbi:hypothetical protein BOTBODRAFT_36661 [Botryobasidium botryosum FD-172 SS1]|uniref:Uncharacterized protein n=1 Tax=Botryobasidium botryosum (strain FD-172 SS1) TaxID=930990 RepID=A0A067MEN0_BOTB1|nr:hypothetical protein BOTBODRAFT_36661 [Botryobasidium botryosum FD-172 SS1]
MGPGYFGATPAAARSLTIRATSRQLLELQDLPNLPLNADFTMSGGIVVINSSTAPVFCYVAREHQPPGGDGGWYKLGPGVYDRWDRPGGKWEVVGFRNGDDTVRGAAFARAGSTVTFNGDFTRIHVLTPQAKNLESAPGGLIPRCESPVVPPNSSFM